MNHTALLTTAQIEELRDSLGIDARRRVGALRDGERRGGADPAPAAAFSSGPSPRRASPDIPRRPRRDIRRDDVDAGGLWSRARRAGSAARRRGDRHRLRRRGGDHASRGLDQSQGRLLSRGAAQLLRGAAAGRASGGNRRRDSTSRSASPSTISSCCWALWVSRASCRADRCCPSGRSTIPSSPAVSMPSTTRSTPAARFIVVATPSGVTLSPEGGAHQSVITPGIGMALPDIVVLGARVRARGGVDPARRPRALGDEREGRSAYLRLSTRPDRSEAWPRRPTRAIARRCSAARTDWSMRAASRVGSRGERRASLRGRRRGAGGRWRRRAPCATMACSPASSR